MTKTMMAILDVLNKNQDRVLGSRELSRNLKTRGVDLTERTIRYHLKIMDERGLTKVFGKEGRRITERGLREMSASLVAEKVGFIISRIETLSYQTTFDPEKEDGYIILNLSLIDGKSLADAMKAMKPVFNSPYVISDRVLVAREGEKIGDLIVPEGKAALGTVCGITMNGIFLKAGIPVTSRFGGVLQIGPEGPSRFTALISYEGSSLDPIGVFIKSRMTSITAAVKNGSGQILASFREIPVVCIDEAKRLQARLKAIGMGGILLIGNPNQPLLEMPVGLDKAGMAIVGGLNPVAALEEAGIRTDSAAMSVLYNYSGLSPFGELTKKIFS